MLQVSAHPGLSCVDLLRELRAGRVPAAANLAAWLASDRPAWVVLWCLQNFAQEGRYKIAELWPNLGCSCSQVRR